MRFAVRLTTLSFLVALAVSLPTHADSWTEISPDHDQTFAAGTEKSRQWILSSQTHDLGLMVTCTNDPYVDKDNPRDYNYSTFHFPQVRLGDDQQTFYFHAPDRKLVPVARIRGTFLGFKWIELLSSSDLDLKKNHGLLTAVLVVRDHRASGDD